MSFFDVVNNLTGSKEYAFDQFENKELDIYMINSAMSNFYDCIMHANALNTGHITSKRMMYDYYHHAIQPKKKRFSKWAKVDKDADMLMVADYYKCNHRHAREYLNMMSEKDLEFIKAKMDKGGRG
jgi:hypothetical protein